VRQAFVDVAERRGGMPRRCAEAWLEQLETTDKRYRPDLWG
jgi:sulfite reductase alpha subunit-like flavoprotein